MSQPKISAFFGVNEKIKLGIVGSRDFKNYMFLKSKLTELFEKNKWEFPPQCVVSGGARGADNLAEIWAKEHDIEMVVLKPDWQKYGKGAGIMRNTDIVNGSTHIVAFVMPTSRGTWDTIRKAQKKGIPVEIIHC